MTRERWGELIDRLRERFPNVTTSQAELDPGPGTLERVEVVTPAGPLKLELTERPRLKTERGRGSHRIGSSVVLEREYDESETIVTFKAYRRQSDGTWTEFDPAAIP